MKKIIFCLFALFCGAGFVWSGNAVAYVSTTGSDTNDGSFSRPYRTIRKALEETSADATLVIRGGDYHEAINISQKPGRRSLLIKAYAGERVRLLGGQCVDKAEPLPGYRKVLKARAGLPSTSPHYRIFQHDVDDPSTLVPAAEHHPLQRGKAYRCSSLPLARVASIEAVEAASSPSYYYDESAGFLYFSLAEGTDLAGHPLYLPGGKGVYGGNDAVVLSMIGIESLYAPFDLSRCSGARIVDCAAMYVFAGGCFMYHMSSGIELVRCEAARAFTESGNGDGFNGHAHLLEGNHPQAKHTSVTLVDCWSHDNYDDGYSNHERCEGVVRGGLFEYNGKFGIGSGYGAHETVYDAICRKNRYGFAICSEILQDEGGYASQMFAYGCVSEANRESGYWVNTSGSPGADKNSMYLYGCLSFGNKVGFESQDGSYLELVDCKDAGSSVVCRGAAVRRLARLVD